MFSHRSSRRVGQSSGWFLSNLMIAAVTVIVAGTMLAFLFYLVTSS